LALDGSGEQLGSFLVELLRPDILGHLPFTPASCILLLPKAERKVTMLHHVLNLALHCQNEQNDLREKRKGQSGVWMGERGERNTAGKIRQEEFNQLRILLARAPRSNNPHCSAIPSALPLTK
jgi:hypothetical protein